jgi:hypothetical protein
VLFCKVLCKVKLYAGYARYMNKIQMEEITAQV